MTNLSHVIKVGIAEMDIVKSPNLIRTSGLGSCVGVIIFDQINKVAGMAHIMLPDSSLATADAVNMAKYADTAVKKLVELIVHSGGERELLKAKIAGGAQMFQFTSGNELLRIGPRNVEAVKKELKKLNIILVADDVGGNSGRTIEFNPENGELQIRTVNQGVMVL